jgi:hypothetical protein
MFVALNEYLSLGLGDLRQFLSVAFPIQAFLILKKMGEKFKMFHSMKSQSSAFGSTCRRQA